jgi:hypothetical protein
MMAKLAGIREAVEDGHYNERGDESNFATFERVYSSFTCKTTATSTCCVVLRFASNFELARCGA